MAYKPKRIQTEFEPSPNGTGIIKLLEKPNIGVKFDDENKNDFAGNKYTVQVFPDYVKNPKILEKYKWYIRLNSEGNEIFSLNPINGEFTGRCVGLAREDGKPPVPKSKDGKFGVYFYFIALIEIIEGDCAGMVVPYILRYNFGEDPDDTGETVYTNWGSDQATHSPKLHQFLDTAGVWNHGAINFSDNVLPIIHKRINSEDKQFKFLMEDGWIVRVWSPEQQRVDSDAELWKDDGWDSSEEKKEPDQESPPWDESDEPEEAKESDKFDWD